MARKPLARETQHAQRDEMLVALLSALVPRYDFLHPELTGQAARCVV